MPAKEPKKEPLRDKEEGRSRSQEKGFHGSVHCVKLCILWWLNKQKKLHSVFFCLSLAIIVYRLPWTWKCSKLLMKSIHAGLNAVAAILAIISLVAAFDFHNTLQIPNMYSLHSWVGLIVVILYMLQVSVLYIYEQDIKNNSDTVDVFYTLIVCWKLSSHSTTLCFTCLHYKFFPLRGHGNCSIHNLWTWMRNFKYGHTYVGKLPLYNI